MSGEPLFQATNNHIADCGQPPQFNSDGPEYIGYYANAFGEQWLFAYNRETKHSVLRGGDVGWDKEYEVQDGTVPELVLGKGEQLWLKACWSATHWSEEITAMWMPPTDGNGKENG